MASGWGGNLDMGTYEYGGAVAVGSVIINSGAKCATSPQVTLSLTWADRSGLPVTRMRCNWSAWETLKDAVTHTLPLSPGGCQTVRAQYRDGAGNISVRYSDYIRLDTPRPETGTAV